MKCVSCKSAKPIGSYTYYTVEFIIDLVLGITV